MIVSPASAREPFNPPIQIWACGMPDHHHRAKGDAVKCLEKQARGAPADRFPPLPETRFASPPEGPQEADRAMKTEAAIDAAKRAIETAEGALAKAEGRKSDEAPDGSTRPSRGVEYADPGYQSDGKPRYPIDTERHIRAAWNYVNRPSNAQRYTSDQVARIRAAIIAAWKDKVDIDGPPSANEDEKASSAALAKALCEAGHVSEIILDLEWLQAALEDEAAIDGNISTQAPRVQALIAELRDLMTALVADETGEFLTSGQIADESLAQLASELITMTAGVPGAARIAALLDAGNPNMQKLASALLAKAKHSQGDQALADMALYACDSCLKIGGLSVAEKAHVTSARDNLRKAGAAPPVTATTDMAGIIAPQMDVPSCDVRSDDMATPDGSIGSGATALGKRAQMHQDLMDVAHDCITKLTGGMACSPPLPGSESAPEGNACSGPAEKTGARHSAETIGHMRGVHDQLVAAGAKCDAAGNSPEQQQGSELESVKAFGTADLAKVLADERAEKTALVTALGEMVPLLDRLSKRVDDIARTPLPPLTIAKGSVSVSKPQDGGNIGSASDSPLSPDAVASALAKMSKEEQTLTLIKASYANPIPVLGVPPGER